MRKGILVLIMFLAACGQEGPENVSKDFEADSKQLLNIFEEAADQTRDLTDKEIELVDSYKLKYENLEDLTEEEGYIHSGVSLASNIVLTEGKLASDYMELEQTTSDTLVYMKTGDIQE